MAPPCTDFLLDDPLYSRHIWKNAGTTIEIQTQRPQRELPDSEIQRRKWVTLVRDPIDHFLSGLTECLSRDARRRAGTKTMDERVSVWVRRVKRLRGKSRCGKCETHSFPQANFLLTREGDVFSQMEFVGHIKELSGLLEMIGIPFNASLPRGKDHVEIKEQFSRNITLLSNNTLRAICELVAIDYFLFDFEPPDACRDLPSLQFQ